MSSELTTAPAAAAPDPAVSADETTDETLLVERVQLLLTEQVHLDVPSPDADLIDTGVLDSLALVEVLLAIEQEFGVEVPLDELEVADFRSVRSIAGLLGARAGAPGR